MFKEFVDLKKAIFPCGNIGGICKQKLHFFNNAFFEMFFFFVNYYRLKNIYMVKEI